MRMEKLLDSCHWLFEAHDPGLVQICMGDREWKLALLDTTLDPLTVMLLGTVLPTADNRGTCAYSDAPSLGSV